MSKELVIGSSRHETKVAILEEDQLVEVYFQRGNEYSLAGSIHKGRVTRVLPGMQSAFVDLGLERDTFLYVSDFFEENDDIDTVGDDSPARSERREPSDRRDNRRGGERSQTDRTQGDRTQGDRVAQGERQIAAPDESQVERSTPDEGPGFFDLSQDPEVASNDVVAMAAEPIGSERNQEDSRGDRGNRRGRRRRPRGRGFPDNKYAQPSSVSDASPAPTAAPVNRGQEDRPAAERTAERSPERAFGERPSGDRAASGRAFGERASGERPSFDRAYADRSTLERAPSERLGGDRSGRREAFPSGDTAASDVMILPGESLAKYRRPATESVSTREQLPVEPLTVTPPEMTGSIHDSEAPDETPDPAAPDESVDEISVEEFAEQQEAIKEEADEIELADIVFSHHENEGVPEDEKLADIEVERIDLEPASEQQVDFAAASEATPYDQEISPIVVDAEPLTTFGASAPLGIIDEDEAQDLEPIDPEAAEPSNGEDIPGEHEATLEAHAGEGPQTASLRDQSGRSMHRGSRRTRRRRGGSRFGGGAAAPEGAAALAVAPVITTGITALVPVESRSVTTEPRREASESRSVERAERTVPSISDLLKAGQEIIVQIAKEPLGQKGARITSHIALPGRYVVFMPSVAHLGVSRKVASDEERQRLKQILQKHRAGTTGGFIVRTAGEGVPEDEIAADMSNLYNLWLDIRQKAEKKPAPALLHYDLDIVQRILRDHVTEDFKAIWVDNEDMYESVLTFMQRFQPTLVSRVKMYTRPAPIFDAFNITAELEKALRPKVWLKSGGYIVINQTEALVAIDINTGKYVGKSNRLEDTIVKTNTEAVKEIVRQIRLRDLGGIIVVDFIDMDERKNRQKVMAALEEAMQTDKAPYKILQFNDFGLVAITRKRVKQSLERTLCSPCSYCEGAGYVKSTQTVIGEILVEAQKIARAIDSKDVVLRVHPEVAKVLKASNNKYLEEVEEILGRPVLVTGDATLHSDKFDLA